MGIRGVSCVESSQQNFPICPSAAAGRCQVGFNSVSAGNFCGDTWNPLCPKDNTPIPRSGRSRRDIGRFLTSWGVWVQTSQALIQNTPSGNPLLYQSLADSVLECLCWKAVEGQDGALLSSPPIIPKPDYQQGHITTFFSLKKRGEQFPLSTSRARITGSAWQQDFLIPDYPAA